MIKSFTPTKLVVNAAVTAALGLGATAASASPYQLNWNGYHTPSPQTVTFTSTSPLLSGTYNAGAFEFTSTDLGPAATVESFTAYCIEITQTLVASASDYARIPFAAFSFSAATQNAIARLYSLPGAYSASLGSSVSSAAFQLALWEIVTETSGTYDVASGSFQGYGAVSGVTLQASVLLASLASAVVDPNLSFNVWSSQAHQNYLQVTARSGGKVPEPGSLLLVGLGLAALAMRRRAE